jgi:hypothetical protein
MTGGNVYKDHTFSKETAPTSHEKAHNLTKTAQYMARFLTVQYKYMNIIEHGRKQKIQKRRRGQHIFSRQSAHRRR